MWYSGIKHLEQTYFRCKQEQRDNSNDKLKVFKSWSCSFIKDQTHFIKSNLYQVFISVLYEMRCNHWTLLESCISVCWFILFYFIFKGNQPGEFVGPLDELRMSCYWLVSAAEADPVFVSQSSLQCCHCQTLVFSPWLTKPWIKWTLLWLLKGCGPGYSWAGEACSC